MKFPTCFWQVLVEQQRSHIQFHRGLCGPALKMSSASQHFQTPTKNKLQNSFLGKERCNEKRSKIKTMS